MLPVGACIGWIVAEGETFVPPPRAHPRRAAPLPRQVARARLPAAAAAPVARASTPPAIARDARDARDAPRRAPGARERGLRARDAAGSGPRGRDPGARLLEPHGASAARAEARAAPAMRSRRGCSGARRADRVPSRLRRRPQRLAAAVHRLLPATLPALAIDLPGHGLTPLGEDASFEALVGAARAALSEEGVGAAHLVGHSLGGAVAAALAHEPGVRALSLMLIAPAGLGAETNAAFFDGFLQADTEAEPHALARYAGGRPCRPGFGARQDHAATAAGAAARRGAAAAAR